MKNNVTFVLDEAASLGNLEPINDALDKYRAYGIRLQFYYQSLGQLKQCFPVDGGQTLLSNCSKTFFGVADLETAKLCSEMLGKQMVTLRSGSKNWGSSDSYSEGQHGNRSFGGNSGGSSGWNEQFMEVLRPEHILNLPPTKAISFIPGGIQAPLMTTLIRYFDSHEQSWLTKCARGWVGKRWESLKVFAWSAVYLTAMLAAAILFTDVASTFHPLERFERYFQSLSKGVHR